MEPVGFPGTEHARNCLRWNQHLGRARAGEWNIWGNEEAAMPSDVFKKAFSLEKATAVVGKFEK